MAAIAAQAGFRLLGARDLERGDDDKTEKMPVVHVAMLAGFTIRGKAPWIYQPHRVNGRLLLENRSLARCG